MVVHAIPLVQGLVEPSSPAAARLSRWAVPRGLGTRLAETFMLAPAARGFHPAGGVGRDGLDGVAVETG